MIITDTLADLVSIDSLSSEEQKIADFLERWLADNTTHHVTRLDDNLLVKVPGKNRKKCLIFNGHIDTVSPGERSLWRTDPFKLTERDDRLYGLGTSDMKGADAAMLYMLKAYDAEMPACDVYVMFVVEEETTGNGTAAVLTHMEEILKSYDDVSAVVGEATELSVVLGHRGGAFAKLTFNGVGGHGSRPPSNDEQAILNATRFIASIPATQLAWSEKYSDDLLGVPNVTVTRLSAGTQGSVNQIPTNCEVTLDVRTVPAFHKNLTENLTAWALLFGAQIKILNPWSAGYCAPTERIAEIAMGLANQTATLVTPGATDQQCFTQAGIPAIICGPGTRNLIHLANESISKELLELCVERYVKIVQAWA